MPGIKKTFSFTAVFLISLLLLSGCGYRPSSTYAKKVIGQKVSTEIVLDLHDPQNAVIIKDAIDSAMITRFQSSLVPKGQADTHLRIRLKSISFAPIQYDVNGYVITYRAKVALEIRRQRKNVVRSYQTSGSYDFAIEPNAVVSDQARFNAIKIGAQKAIDSYIAQVANEGSRI